MSRRISLPLLLLAVAGCDLPRDPEGTLERVRGGTLRAGVVPNPPWVVVEAGRVRGVEPALVRRFARSLDARIEWVAGTESELLERLETRDLDLVAGGLTRSNPWGSRVGLTRPYPAPSGYAPGERRVLAVPPGENAWLVRLERFLHRRASPEPGSGTGVTR